MCVQPGDPKIPEVIDVCLLAVAGPFPAVGLVDLPGRLREADVQVPESQPSHRLGPSGQVSAFILVTPNLSLINKSSCCCSSSRKKCQLSQPGSPDWNAVRELGGVSSRVTMGFEPRLPALQSALLTTPLACKRLGWGRAASYHNKISISWSPGVKHQYGFLFDRLMKP